MFTGIVETTGKIICLEKEQENIHLTIESDFTSELKIDQSVAHNGICLTVVEINNNQYKVTAIKETIEKTTIGLWQEHQEVNLERALKFGDRLDGHLVQGHVDQTAQCTKITSSEGSTYFTFTFDDTKGNTTIEKGSITVDGTSLTVVQSDKNTFSVAIIPYTLEHTLFKEYKIGTRVNLEFDIIGKYLKKLAKI